MNLVPVLSPPPIERDESLERVPQEIYVDRVDGVKVAEVDEVNVAVEGGRPLRRHDQLHELALEKKRIGRGEKGLRVIADQALN